MADYPGYDTFCKYCGKPIIFIYTANGKLMPCDATPVRYWPASGPDMGVVVYQRNGTYVRAMLDGHPAACAGSGYRPHWASCTKRRDKPAKPKPQPDSPARKAIRERIEKERAAKAAREAKNAAKRAAEQQLKEAEARQLSLFCGGHDIV